MFRVLQSTSAAARLRVARAFVAAQSPFAQIAIVGASRGAADDFARDVARAAGATFGLTRFSLTELAARAAAARFAETRRAPATMTGAEAIAARAVFDLKDQLRYFEPVAGTPGFPKALARTVHELRLAGTPRARIATAGLAGGDLGRLIERIESELDRAGVDDRAALFREAAAACTAGLVPWTARPVVLLDVTLDSKAERDFASALVANAPAVLATLPGGDEVAREAFVSMGAVVETIEDDARPGSDLASLRQFVFEAARPAPRERAGDVSLFSAPGEAREAVEIVRRALDEAATGVPFDEMAIFVRAPQQYLGLLDQASARGDVPVYFDRGTRRPDPAGRAFVALLACAAEGLSARRFDEYLSLGQVPAVGGQAQEGRGQEGRGQEGRRQEGRGQEGQVGLDRASAPELPLIRSQDEAVAGLMPEQDAPDDEPEIAEGPAPIDTDDDAIIAGTLRAPWRWEELIVESHVVGGRTREEGKRRWRRRLDGLASDYQIRIDELRKEEPESARIARFTRDLRNLAHLRRFALPIIDALADWPEQATWGEWLDLFTTLAPRALRRPERVLQVLADLRPMAAVGPVHLDEARRVLHDRLVALDWDPPARRYGRVFVGTPHQARGRSFRVVFVPGLAERVVPQRPREDPLLLDDRRRAIDPTLVSQAERGAAERLLLKIAIGAARERLYLSYPRIETAESRPRVPSFYALDVVRAVTGEVPDHRALAATAAEEGGASLAWPAPKNPDHAIDDLEHDLATLRPLLDARDRASVKGHAHYMLGLNEALRRSVISRWSRGRSAWAAADGLVKPMPALARHRLSARPFSLSALQRFATCPYQFLLATIHRLEPWDEPEPIVRMDPLTRGSLFHSVQAEFYRALEAAGELPLTRERLAAASRTLDEVVDRVAAVYEEKLAPAIERVWRDEIAELRRDLGIWIQKIAGVPEWRPRYFEFSFGLSDEGRDPRSLEHPINVDGRFILRGSVDLIEEHAELGFLRVTDHKTGKNRSTEDEIVRGGTSLQPVLYSVAIEQGLGRRVAAGRLFYCTTAGGFADHEIAINDYNRTQGIQVLEIVDRAIGDGFLVPSPAERACTWCDFRPVCGPREPERVKRKTADRLADLEALREMR